MRARERLGVRECGCLVVIGFSLDRRTVEIDAAPDPINIAPMIGALTEGTKRFFIAEHRVFAVGSLSF